MSDGRVCAPSRSNASARGSHFLLDLGRWAVKDSARTANWCRSDLMEAELPRLVSFSFGLIRTRISGCRIGGGHAKQAQTRYFG